MLSDVRQMPRAESLSLQVAEQLEAMISTGRIAVGQTLPSEIRLCESFGVSRTVVREAIAHLKSLGLVATRRGVGTKVIRAAAFEALSAEGLHPTTVEEILHVLELRLEVEPAMAEFAAFRHSVEDRHRLQETHTAFIRAGKKAKMSAEEDFAFHRAIAMATGNPCFTAFYEQLRNSVIPRANLICDVIVPLAPGQYLSRAEEEHTRIIEAILDRDAKAARESMFHHLNRARTMYAKFQNS